MPRNLLARYRQMQSHIWTCVAGIFDHWLAIVTGSGVSLFILIKEKATDKPVRWKAILAIFFGGFLISLFFAWQDEYTSAEWRGTEIARLGGLMQGKDDQIKILQNELMLKDRPVILQYTTDPKLAKLLNQNTLDLARLKNSLPSPKKKALQLSNDMIKFSQDVTRNQPTPPIFQGATTREEIGALMGKFEQGYVQWMNNMAANYNGQFAVRIVSLEEDVKAAGLPDTLSMCEHSNGNTFGMERCAALVGVMAEKLPE
jgi:hypothetical protein